MATLYLTPASLQQPRRHRAPFKRMNLSIIICTHNPRADYLSRTLDALRQQTLSLAEWELLLIDNASQPPVDTLVSLAWQPNGRHIREENLGLTPARLRGIKESKGQLLVFVDDDSILEASYLETAMAIGMSRPDLACWGAGHIEPEYETPPPAWLRAYDSALAIRRLDRDLWANIPAVNHSLPWGLGMCLRKEVAMQYSSLCQKDDVRRSLDRSGRSLASGGDTDIALLSCVLGGGTAVFTGLRITHLIPQRRTTPEYMCRLIEGKAESAIIISSLYTLGKNDLSLQRLRILKLKYLLLWMRYIASGFSVHFRLSRSKMRGEIQGFERLRNLGLLRENVGLY